MSDHIAAKRLHNGAQARTGQETELDTQEPEEAEATSTAQQEDQEGHKHAAESATLVHTVKTEKAEDTPEQQENRGPEETHNSKRKAQDDKPEEETKQAKKTKDPVPEHSKETPSAGTSSASKTATAGDKIKRKQRAATTDAKAAATPKKKKKSGSEEDRQFGPEPRTGARREQRRAASTKGQQANGGRGRTATRTQHFRLDSSANDGTGSSSGPAERRSRTPVRTGNNGEESQTLQENATPSSRSP